MTDNITDKTPDKSFIDRWSRTKLAEADKADKAEEPESLSHLDQATGDLPATTDDETPIPEELTPPDLPDIEAMDGESDYTPFLGDNVPEELARKALSKLWRSDPVFANLDGLNDYDEDYSSLGIVKTVVETAYKVGRGIVQDDEAEIPEDEDAEDAEELQGTDEIDIEEESGDDGDENPVEMDDQQNQTVPHGGKDEH